MATHKVRLPDSPEPLPQTIEAQISGEISGQVAVGTSILQIGSIHGGVVNIAPPQAQPTPGRVPPPVFLRPRAVRNLLGRREEVEAALVTLQSSEPLEFHGEQGLGKTTLLRYLAYHSPPDLFPDGIVYISARRQPAEDVLQFLFDAIYQCDVPFKPTEGQLCRHLQSIQALVLLDDADLDRDDVQCLFDTAPQSVFILTSTQRRLWGEGKALALRGLAEDEAVALLEQELARPLVEGERASATALIAAVSGHPQRILQAAALVREEGRSLSEVAAELGSARAPQAIPEQLIGALPEPQLRLLAVLAALDGAPLNLENVAALTGLSDAGPLLEALLARGLVQAHSPRYSLAFATTPQVHDVLGSDRWREPLLDYLTTFAQEHRDNPDRQLEEAEAILATLDWASKTGRRAKILPLVRAVEGSLALRCRWGEWQTVLFIGMDAALALGDRAGEAWALHQLGTRALGLEDFKSAQEYLNRALQIRKSLGDEVGAEVTRYHLDGGTSEGLSALPSAWIPLTFGAAFTAPWLLYLLAAPVLLLLGAFVALVLLSGSPLQLPEQSDSNSQSAPQGSDRSPSDRSQEDGGAFGSENQDDNQREPSILSIAPTRLDFGDQRVGTVSEARVLTITNRDTQSVTIDLVALTGDHAGEFAVGVDSCGGVRLAPGGSCTVDIRFAPIAAGARRATVTLYEGDNILRSPHTATLLGRGAGGLPVPVPVPVPDPVVVVRKSVAGHAFVAKVTTDPRLLDLTVGSVEIPSSGGFQHRGVALDVPPLLSADAAETSSAGSFREMKPTASSSAEVANLCLLPTANGCTIRARGVRSQANSTATQSSASSDDTGTRLLGLEVAGRRIRSSLSPNTRIDLAGLGFVIVNEQFCEVEGSLPDCTRPGRSEAGRTVRALHVVVTVPDNPFGLTVGAEIIVAEASAGASCVSSNAEAPPRTASAR